MDPDEYAVGLDGGFPPLDRCERCGDGRAVYWTGGQMICEECHFDEEHADQDYDARRDGL